MATPPELTCRNCGYPREHASPVCPECGSREPPASSRRYPRGVQAANFVLPGLEVAMALAGYAAIAAHVGQWMTKDALWVIGVLWNGGLLACVIVFAIGTHLSVRRRTWMPMPSLLALLCLHTLCLGAVSRLTIQLWT